MEDKNFKTLKNGDIIDLHQTVNGQSKFVMLDVEKLHMVYAYDPNEVYEYDVKSTLEPSKLTGEIEWEIIGNIYELVTKPRKQMVSVDDVHDQVSARLAIILARHCVTRPFEHVDFDVEFEEKYPEDGSMTFNPKNFFTALLYEGIYFPQAIDGVEVYVTDKGKFVWEEDRLYFASIKE